MKKTVLIQALLLFMALTYLLCLSACEQEPEKVYGKIVVHNDADSGATITRIRLTGVPWLGLQPDTIITERISITPGQKSRVYDVEITKNALTEKVDNGFRVIITVNEREIRAEIEAYQNQVNNLYFDGTNLAER